MKHLYGAGVIKDDNKGMVHVVDDPNERVQLQSKVKSERYDGQSSFDFINSANQPPGQAGSALDDGYQGKDRKD